MKVKEASHAANTANGTITDTKQLSPEAGVSGFDGLPYLTLASLFIVNMEGAPVKMLSVETKSLSTHSLFLYFFHTPLKSTQ